MSTQTSVVHVARALLTGAYPTPYISTEHAARILARGIVEIDEARRSPRFRGPAMREVLAEIDEALDKSRLS